jgi:exodeoxyribonuclease VII small subunit
MAKDTLSFEQAIGRLEKIVEAMEQGKIGLEESVKHFEEGMGLIARCRKVLAEAEMKIQQLQAAGESGAAVADSNQPPIVEA